MEQKSIQVWDVGLHRVQFEPPNLVVLHWRGAVLAEHVDGVFGRVDQIEAPRFWVLSDISDSDTPTAQVRARIAKTESIRRIDGIAIVVSNSSKRVVMEMLLRAMNFLMKMHLKPAFFAEESAARAHLAIEMRRFQKIE